MFNPKRKFLESNLYPNTPQKSPSERSFLQNNLAGRKWVNIHREASILGCITAGMSCASRLLYKPVVGREVGLI